MLPHSHFVFSGFAVALVAILWFPQQSAAEVLEWILVGGLVSAAVDLDVVALVFVRSGKESSLTPFRNPVHIHKHYKKFMDTLAETGLLATAMKTHILISAAVVAVAYSFHKPYFIPATLGVLSHLITDTPHLRKL